MLWFCQNSASGQNNIVPHLLRRSINVFHALPFHVRFQEKTSNLAWISNFLLPRLRKAFQWTFRFGFQRSSVPERCLLTRCFLATEIQAWIPCDLTPSNGSVRTQRTSSISCRILPGISVFSFSTHWYWISSKWLKSGSSAEFWQNLFSKPLMCFCSVGPDES